MSQVGGGSPAFFFVCFLIFISFGFYFEFTGQPHPAFRQGLA
jgi:hypothetical protein